MAHARRYSRRTGVGGNGSQHEGLWRGYGQVAMRWFRRKKKVYDWTQECPELVENWHSHVKVIQPRRLVQPPKYLVKGPGSQAVQQPMHLETPHNPDTGACYLPP